MDKSTKPDRLELARKLHIEVATVRDQNDELRVENKVLRLRGDTYLEQLQQKHAESERLRAAMRLAITVITELASQVYGGDWESRHLAQEVDLDDEVGTLRETLDEIRKP